MNDEQKIRKILAIYQGIPLYSVIEEMHMAVLNKYRQGSSQFENCLSLIFRSLVTAYGSQDTLAAFHRLCTIEFEYKDYLFPATSDYLPTEYNCVVRDELAKKYGNIHKTDSGYTRSEDGVQNFIRKHKADVREEVKETIQNNREWNENLLSSAILSHIKEACVAGHSQKLAELKPIDRDNIPSVDWLVPDLMVRGSPMVIGGPQKCLKTTIAVDLAVCLATGSTFLGLYSVPKPQRVLLFSGESGAAKLAETMIDIEKSHAVTQKDQLLLFPYLPDESQLIELVDTYSPDVVILDPLYLYYGKDVDSVRIGQVGEKLKSLEGACKPATLVLVHHATKEVSKNHRGALELTDLTGSGVSEFAGQWLLVNRKAKYKAATKYSHNLIVSGGGRHRQCYQHNLEIIEKPEYTVSVIEGKPEREEVKEEVKAKEAASPKELQLWDEAVKKDGDIAKAAEAIPDSGGSWIKKMREKWEKAGWIRVAKTSGKGVNQVTILNPRGPYEAK